MEAKIEIKKQAANGWTVLYTLDGEYQEAQVNLANANAALDAAKTYAGNVSGIKTIGLLVRS